MGWVNFVSYHIMTVKMIVVIVVAEIMTKIINNKVLMIILMIGLG